MDRCRCAGALDEPAANQVSLAAGVAKGTIHVEQFRNHLRVAVTPFLRNHPADYRSVHIKKPSHFGLGFLTPSDHLD